MGKLDCAHFLIKHGAKVNSQLECGRYGSMLAAAAYRGQLETVQFLVRQHNVGVKTNLEFGDFGSPLAAAVAMGNVNCARFLVKHGADVNAYMEFGKYGSVMAAAILGPEPSLTMVKFLVEKTDLNTSWLTVVQPRNQDEKWEHDSY
jgi:ankyrin repeat protein